WICRYESRDGAPVRAVDRQARQRAHRLPAGCSAFGIQPFLPNSHAVEKVIKAEGLIINPELVAIVGVEAAHMLELPERPLYVKGNADFLGPFTLGRLIERLALFDTAAGKLRYLRRTGLRGKHDRVVTNGEDQRKHPSARLDH